MPFRSLFCCAAVSLIALLFLSADLAAETPSFDLAGPKVEVRVMRQGKTLPIAMVPDLEAGDRLWIHPGLPESQSVHYLMVVVFLRGATNPPPDSWFTRVETWNKSVREEGITIIVPNEAAEALILLAPETGGAYAALRKAVTGKPGAFVRAAQDLAQASVDRARVEKYLETLREISEKEPDEVKSRTTLLARSLNIRLDQQCFDKPTAQQVPCLAQNTEQLVLDDGHSQSMLATYTSGASADLVSQVSATSVARSGYYSPYVGSVVDVVRILEAAHTAQFQYIPALSLPQKDNLNLRLNNPPSFRSPKSVLVIGLPLVREPAVPPLRPIDVAKVFCADQPHLVLPADGAPVAFATELAHDFVLHLETKSGRTFELPARADAGEGGFAVNTEAIRGADIAGELTGVLRGSWGFRTFDGPHFRLRASHAEEWIVESKDASALIVGREDTLHLRSPGTCCVREVVLADQKGINIKADWKAIKPDELEVNVKLDRATPGSATLLVRKFGLSNPDEIVLHTYADAGRLDSFSIDLGDAEGVLKGTRLDQVTRVEVNGIQFTPGALTRANQSDELKVAAIDTSAASKLSTTELPAAKVTLKDGRVLEVKTVVGPPRPEVSLLSKNVEPALATTQLVVQLGSADELPQDGRLNFFIKTRVPEDFPPTEKIEVATADESFHVALNFTDGNLTLQDAHTVLAVLDPMKLLGPSAFGPLKFRPVSHNGVSGDWQPLINLVRVPTLGAVHCGATSETQCTLSGEKLFLIDALSTEPDFSNSVTVPDGFVQASLVIPAPRSNTLYLRLRDDPAKVVVATVPVATEKP